MRASQLRPDAGSAGEIDPLDTANSRDEEITVNRHPRRAFTLIEILIVIGIISVLVTLVTLGVRQIGNTGRAKSTRVTMENLQNLVTEKQVTGGVGALDEVYPLVNFPAKPPDAPTAALVRAEAAPPNVTRNVGKDRNPVWSGSPLAPQNAIARTQAVVALLRAVPNNAKWISALPSNQIWLPKVPSEVPGPPGSTIPIILDAWGNPIIYVPSGGLTGVTVSGNVKSKYADFDVTTAQDTVESPSKRGFWASAGPDGFFTDPDPSKSLDEREPYGDDNVYSFQQ
jgi:prepilin-type N-terminal cleavage/methylation domain-containing protein